MGRILLGMALSLVCLRATPFFPLDSTRTRLTPPAILADLELAGSVDRSPEMGETEAIVASAQMITSIQLSFDTRFDLGGRLLGGTEGFFDARRLSPYARSIDKRQVDLTLGVAFKGFESEAANYQANTSYVSFSLVNQAHASTRPVIADDEPEEDDATLLEGKP